MPIGELQTPNLKIKEGLGFQGLDVIENVHEVGNVAIVWRNPHGGVIAIFLFFAVHEIGQPFEPPQSFSKLLPQPINLA